VCEPITDQYKTINDIVRCPRNVKKGRFGINPMRLITRHNLLLCSSDTTHLDYFKDIRICTGQILQISNLDSFQRK